MTRHSEISMPVPVALSCPGESVVADAAGIGMETSQSDDNETRIRIFKEIARPALAEEAA